MMGMSLISRMRNNKFRTKTKIIVISFLKHKQIFNKFHLVKAPILEEGHITI